MSVGACFIVEVAIGRRSEGVCWLVLQHDAESTKGWYLFQHADLQEPAKFDSWHQPREQAEQQAVWQYGVSPDDWRTANPHSDG